MKEIHICDNSVLDEMLRVYKSDVPVAVFEFPKVFGLMAPHSLKGALTMSGIKKRLPHKYYSSFLGDEAMFQRMVPENLKTFYDYITTEVEGASVRLPLSSAIKHPEVTSHEATHQILLEHQSLRSTIHQLDRALQSEFSKSDFYDVNYQSPLVSSLNLSGAKTGSIVNKEEALDFAKKAKIPLFIHTDKLEQPLGSYPIFSISRRGKVTCEREGLNHLSIEKQIVAFFENNPAKTLF